MNKTEALKIGILSAYSFRTPGGVQDHMLEQARALRKLGHSVTIMAADLKHSAYPLDTPAVSCGWSLGMRGNGSVAHIALSPRGFFRILKTMKKMDIVHVHEPFYPFTLLLLHFSGVPVVATFHAQHEPNLFYGLCKYILGLNRIWKRLKKRIAVSEKARSTVARYFKGDVTVIPNGIDTERKMPVKKRTTGKKKSILFLGRNEERKGLPLLLEAFENIRKKHPEIQLILAGPGTEKVSTPGVRGYGLVDPQTKDRLLVNSDCLCVPSTGKESFGIILLEGMRAKTPIVASDIPGYRTTLKNRENALLFSVGDPQALENTLLRVLEKKQISNTLIKNGLKTCSQYGWKEIARRLYKEYRTIDLPKRGK